MINSRWRRHNNSGHNNSGHNNSDEENDAVGAVARAVGVVGSLVRGLNERKRGSDRFDGVRAVQRRRVVASAAGVTVIYSLFFVV